MGHRSSTSTKPLRGYGRRGLLLLGLSALTPAAFGQSFAPVSTYATGAGSGPYGLALGDVNGDGRPDIVSANMLSSTVGVLLGQAGGGFAAVSLYSTGTGSNPSCVALADVNGDGRTDIISANVNTHSVGVLLGQAGGFAPPIIYPTGPVNNPSPYGLALGDVNGDGRLDIVTANTGTSAVAVLTGRAGGSFATATLYPFVLGDSPYAVALGDINGDGRPDIVTANYYIHTTVVLLGQANGRFATGVAYSTTPGSYPRSVALGDVNGDGQLDIVTANTTNTSSGTAGVLLGQAGGFAPARTFPVGGSKPVGIALGDINGDGWLDIVTANIDTNDAGVLLGQAGRSFAPARTYSTGAGSAPNAVALADMNGDGRLDMVTVNSSSNTVGVLLNTGTFTPLANAYPTAAEVALYPNPAHDAFTVQLPATFRPTSAELLNALGQVVRRPATGTASFGVETSGLPPGVYTLRLQAGGTALARRVVVQ